MIYRSPGQSISIREYIQERRALCNLKEALEGPLSEYEYSDGDSDGEPTIRAAQAQGDRKRLRDRQASDSDSLSYFDKKSKRSARRRRTKRLLDNRSSNGMGHTNTAELPDLPPLKKVNKKRRAEAATDALELDTDLLNCIQVTRPGWIAKTVNNLPEVVFGKEELEAVYGMTTFEWDGLCVFHKFSFYFYSRFLQEATYAD